ncbi:hypothetical protein VULLAG_LOCUS4499 [Vulpes lagopus]
MSNNSKHFALKMCLHRSADSPVCFIRLKALKLLQGNYQEIPVEKQCLNLGLLGKLNIRKLSIGKQTIIFPSLMNIFCSLGHLGGSVVECLPSAQDMIPGSWNRVLNRAPCMEPASPSACVSASLCLS